MPDISTLNFDLTDCSPQKQEPRERTWMNTVGVMHKLQFTPGPEDWWPFDLSNVAAARDFYGKECSSFGGAVLSLDVIKVAGAEVLRGVFKYRSPLPDHLGMYFTGILWLPFKECFFQLNIEAIEGGTTGIREAAIMAVLGDAWPMSVQEEIPVIENDEQLQALYKAAREKPLSVLPSDEERYDQSFSSHPLSLVRARLDKVTATLSFDPAAGTLNPFRLPAKKRSSWKFWS